MRTELFIDGKWVKGSSTAPVYDPADGSVIAEVHLANDELCEAAVTAAHNAQADWAKTAPRVRAEILRKAYELMVAESETIATLISKENGKAMPDARGEALYAAEFFRWFSEETVRVEGDFRKSPSGDKRILVTHQPIGVSLLITPWNCPAGMATRKIGPAVAAGCTMILKPAGETPLTALHIVDIMERAGLPKGVLNLILPEKTGPQISKMLHDPRVKNLSFTGSTEVGKHLIKEAADQVIRCSMELGGNAPVIVLDDANIEKAVAGIILAKMRNGGAACTAANRFFIHESIHDKFVDMFSRRMSSLVLGNGLDAGTHVGPLISRAQQDNVASLVEGAVAGGATVVCGGKRASDTSFGYHPTVLTDVGFDAAILKDEVFGPVAPIVKFRDVDDILTHCNSVEHGLVSYVFTRDVAKGLRFAESLETGMIGLNRGLVSDPAAPFGGVKASGIGREGGHDGLLAFLETKYVAGNW